jgi:hypothetical protein
MSTSVSDKYCWPIAGGIGGIAVEVAVVGQSSPLVPQTTNIAPIAGGIGGVAVVSRYGTNSTCLRR